MVQPPAHSAQGTLLLNDPRTAGGIGDDIGFFLDPNRFVRNQAEIIESPQVAARASEILGGDPSPDEVRGSISATAASDRDAVVVHGTQATAAGAVALVDAVVIGYEETIRVGIQVQVDASIATLQESKATANTKANEFDAALAADPENAALEAQRNAAVAQLVGLDTRIEQLTTGAALYGSGVQLYVAPSGAAQTQPRPVRNAVIAATLAMIAASAWAWWRAEQDERIDDQATPARILEAPLLAVVPDYRDVGASEPIPTVTAADSGAAQAYHFAVSALAFALDGNSGVSVVVTSTGAGDGKTVTALNIAIAAAEDGRNTLLIDADARVSGLTKLSGFSLDHGLANLTNGGDGSRLIRDWYLSDQDYLRFVPAGTGLNGDIAGYFRSTPFREALPKLLAGRDLVLIDTPPVMSAAETTDIAAAADGTILVVVPGTELRHLADAKERLALSGTPILGYVYNRARRKNGAYGHGYGYGYGYGGQGD